MIPPSERLEIFDDGETDEEDQQSLRNADTLLKESHEISSTPHNRQRRDVAEMNSLQAQLAAVTLRLKQLKQTRSICTDVLLKHGSYWRTEAKYQSKQRASAQLENERLRALLQDQKQFALRFVNVMKRTPFSRTIQTLDRYAHAARKRAKKRDDEFGQAWADIDAELAPADLVDGRPNVYILRPGCRAFSIMVRRSLRLSCDLVAASDAIWRFRPHEELRRHFIYEYIETSSGSTVGYTSRFQPKESSPTPMLFRVEFLQQRKSTAKDMVAIAWKIQAHNMEPDLSEQLHMWGHGHHVIWSETRNGENHTILRSSSWFAPESATMDPNQAQRDPRFQVMMGFLKHGFEFFTALTKELGAQSNCRDTA